jgi:hypothetical protein
MWLEEHYKSAQLCVAKRTHTGKSSEGRATEDTKGGIAIPCIMCHAGSQASVFTFATTRLGHIC